MHYSLFNSHLIYTCQIRGKLNQICLRKFKSLRNKRNILINFLPNTVSSLKIIKLSEYISLQNVLFAEDFFDEKFPETFTVPC